jgi:hypothetical protein
MALARPLVAGEPKGAAPVYPDDPTVWPNRTSHANSDAWLPAHHDRLRVMEPRVLVINFANEQPRARLELLVRRLIAALAEGSRYHGYKDLKARPFLKYKVLKFVDLRDGPDLPAASLGRAQAACAVGLLPLPYGALFAPGTLLPRGSNSSKLPLKEEQRHGFNVRYQAFFEDAFAGYYGVPDPKRPGRCLRLDELVDQGFVHEVWFLAEHTPPVNPFEVVQLMPVYDEQFRRRGNQFVQAGNGGDPDMKWTGRSLRIGFINASRGIGCFLESLSHGMEGNANSGAIPYFTRYFKEYAGLDLDRRYGLPVSSFYACDYGAKPIRYPAPNKLVLTYRGKEYRLQDYVAFGGNAHFPPNGRWHYDLDNQEPVLSTIEDWRVGSGPGGKDRARPWTVAAFRQYRDLAPDCMGPWLVYWRQNMPGLGNRARDADGRPMKNWWPFLFY